MKLAEYIDTYGVMETGSYRFAFITDLHIRNTSPSKRKDNYHSAFLSKLNWVCETALRIGCEDVLLGGGDIFDIPVVNLERADDFVEVLRSHGMSLATIFGNHDVANTLATSARSLLGHLMRRVPDTIKLLPILTEKPMTIANLDIWGHHYKHNNHQDLLEVKITSMRQRLIISHSMILDAPAPFGEDSFTLFQNVATNANVILLGHYHPQQKVQTIDNSFKTLIGGPGAFMRGALSRDDLSRQPAMAVLEVGEHTSRVDFIDIDVAKPADQIFLIEEARAEAAQLQAMDAFRLGLQDMKVDSFDLPGLIEEIAKSDKVPEAVKQEALRRIGAIS